MKAADIAFTILIIVVFLGLYLSNILPQEALLFVMSTTQEVPVMDALIEIVFIKIGGLRILMIVRIVLCILLKRGLLIKKDFL